MDEMQAELAGEQHALEVHLLGVNHTGLEAGNAEICAGRDIPWLQDVPAVDAWGAWGVTLRDVVILDEQNRVVGTYNLSVHSLEDPANYAELKAMLVAAANP